MKRKRIRFRHCKCAIGTTIVLLLVCLTLFNPSANLNGSKKVIQMHRSRIMKPVNNASVIGNYINSWIYGRQHSSEDIIHGNKLETETGGVFLQTKTTAVPTMAHEDWGRFNYTTNAYDTSTEVGSSTAIQEYLTKYDKQLSEALHAATEKVCY